ncbi:MAG: four helix bundle protein [Cyclobacteriaceae bacterium]
MSTFKTFEDIEAWANARKLAHKIYLLANEGSFSRDFRLRDQVNDAAGSIMDNIAEGFERDGVKEFIQFLSISKGSCGEVRSQLYRALDRGHISQEDFEEIKREAIHIGRQIAKLMSYLKSTGWRGSKFVNEPDVDYEKDL